MGREGISQRDREAGQGKRGQLQVNPGVPGGRVVGKETAQEL